MYMSAFVYTYGFASGAEKESHDVPWSETRLRAAVWELETDLGSLGKP